jgi:hypothetical protein
MRVFVFAFCFLTSWLSETLILRSGKNQTLNAPLCVWFLRGGPTEIEGRAPCLIKAACALREFRLWSRRHPRRTLERLERSSKRERKESGVDL